MSIHSQKSDGKEEQQQQPTSPLVDKMEASSKGVVEGSVYLHYFKASGSLLLFLVVICFFILTQTAASGTDYWIAYW